MTTFTATPSRDRQPHRKPERRRFVGQGVFASALSAPPAIIVLIACYLVPLNISLGGLVFTPVRFTLITLFVPTIFALLRSYRFTLADPLFALHGLWVALSFSVVHGAEQGIKSGGIYGVEVISAYLFGRCFIRTREHFMSVVALLFLFVLITLPFIAVEAVTGRNLFRLAMGQNWLRTDVRFGIARSAGPLQHAILYGAFCASLLAMLVAFQRDRGMVLRNRVPQIIALGLCTVASVSSGALATFSVQIYMLVWERLTRRMNSRWMVLLAILALCYGAVELASNRPALMVALNYLSFNPHTAYWRTIIFQYGMISVWRHPVFGIGFNEWERPPWMHSASMDNYWLVVAVRHGFPAFLTAAGAILWILWRNRKAGDVRLSNVRSCYNMSLIGLIIGGCTVHYWGPMITHFAFLIGMGAAVSLLPSEGSSQLQPKASIDKVGFAGTGSGRSNRRQFKP